MPALDISRLEQLDSQFGQAIGAAHVAIGARMNDIRICDHQATQTAPMKKTNKKRKRAGIPSDLNPALVLTAYGKTMDETPIEYLTLSTRATNCLKYDLLDTVGQVYRKTDLYLLRLPNLGQKSLNEIWAAIREILISTGGR